MAALLRGSTLGLAQAALAAGTIKAYADLFVFTLLDGSVHRWTSWDQDLTFQGQIYASKAPWLECTDWDVSNTMETPEMKVYLRAFNTSFNGGASIKAQVHNGLFDGCAVLMSMAVMMTPGVVYDAIPLFGGKTAGIDLGGATATIAVRGKNNDLDQYAPRNMYQISCNHAFCDAGCTLLKSAFTASFAAGSSGLTSSFIPWAVAPGNATNYQHGTVKMTSGAASGQTRTVAHADSTGLTLVYPLYETPAPGDTFNAVEGCSKAYNDGTGQSCTDRSNTQHNKAYEFVPPPNSAY
jgi:uncharacterized phage protein (TIGR02218 family)